MQEIPSKYLARAVDQMASLQGIGKKTALRLVLQLLKRSETEVLDFARSFSDLKQNIKTCSRCFNLSDTEVCQICSDTRRDPSMICVVENIRDVLAIESTGLYKGLYHVLGGLISPMEGIGPQQLNIQPLVERCQSQETSEVIFALNTNMEGETTHFYLYRKLKEFPLKISTLARGLSFGDELEYADELSLGRSIENRIPFNG